MNYFSRKVHLLKRSIQLGADTRTKFQLIKAQFNWLRAANENCQSARIHYNLKGKGGNFSAIVRDLPTDWIIFREIFYFDDYIDLTQLDWEPNTIYDIGANAGLAALYMHSIFPKAKIYGFEPGKAEFENAKLNYTQNNLGVIYPIGAGDENGSAVFYASEARSGGQGFAPSEEFKKDATTYTVQLWRLDDYIVDGNLPLPDLIKMDIEGFEVKALTGMDKALSHAKAIILETHGEELHAGVIKKLSEFGYKTITDSHRFSKFRILFSAK
ncbi:FkbM family methyltransferase [Luteolibacter pohnpeiensis]|uniref:FkbM family methyltransferase n=1 Tax=Luteolibacter pohnpeiensis TaxID=454153 RepID=A0A934VQU3_9BACT|nr:FkbM family methyltransferase [Luteolibacter pohnpeiensis]MBK1882471.1 FkbM family methyltransferase [Luteolibacter pohnpeiensis]